VDTEENLESAGNRCQEELSSIPALNRMWPCGGIGRRTGLKILGLVTDVSVRVRSGPPNLRGFARHTTVGRPPDVWRTSPGGATFFSRGISSTMKKTRQYWVNGLLLLACLVNSIFLFPKCWQAFVSVRTLWGLTNAERRALMFGNWYSAVLNVQNHIPLGADIRLVSKEFPWYLTYFLYPRLIRAGSSDPTALQSVRQKYDQEWVLLYQEGEKPELTPYPPFRPKKT
jgi:hypothetical protein